MGDQRRSSWPWRKLKASSASSAKAGDRSSRSSPSQLVSPASSFTASTHSARFAESLTQEASTSALVEDGRLLEANVLREQAEESLRALKQELSNVTRDMIAKEALVKQHQKVADEAISGWEKAEKDALSLKQDLEGATQQRVILEDRSAQLDSALKECMKQVRHVRDEQEGKIQEAITCKTREWDQIKAELEAKQVELQRRLLESDAQNSAMVKSLQERARKILDANDAKSKVETELKVLQVKLGASEKDISTLHYELQLLSKELEIRNEEVAFCKKSADIAHNQHLDDVHKLAKLEADCQRLRSLVKKKLPGPAAIAQMRKEVEGLPQGDSASVTSDFKRRPNRSYASSTISFTNSHQRGITTSINRDVDALRERLLSMEEENKLLKEALSKRIGELQTSWLLCAKTASKLSIAEDQLESLQGTPRGARINGSVFNFSTARESSFASVSDGFGSNEYEEEASCAESWASKLIGELAQFRKENITAKETIKEVTEPYKSKESVSSIENGSVVHAEEVVLDKEECRVHAASPETKMQLAVEIGNPLAHQDGELRALSLLCKDLDHKLTAIEEQLRTGCESKKEHSAMDANLVQESLISLVDAAQQKFSELEKAIQGMGSMSMHTIPDHAASNAAVTSPMSECRLDAEMPTLPSISTMQEMDPMPLQPEADRIGAIAKSCESLCEGEQSTQGQAITIITATTSTTSVVPAAVAEEDPHHQLAAPMQLMAMSISAADESKLNALIARRDQNGDPITEDKHESVMAMTKASIGLVLCRLIALLELLPVGATLDADCTGGKRVGATLDADCTGGKRGDEHWQEEKQGLQECKERIVAGQASVLEFLVRVGMVVSRACGAADVAGELHGMLDTIKRSGGEGAGESEAIMPRQRQGGEREGEVEADVAEEVRELRGQLAGVEREREKAGEEREKLQEEVARHKELQREAEARCEELLQKIQGFEWQQQQQVRLAVKVAHDSHAKLPKESELVEAKEKLAECERTILVLGKQLHSLSSLQQPYSPFDYYQHVNTPLPRHHPDTLPRHPHHADMDESHSEIYDVDQPPRPRGRKLHCHVVSGPQDRRFAQQSGSFHVAQSQHTKAHRPVYVDSPRWQQQEAEPPLSARSSPNRSPARYSQQVPGHLGSIGRTNLTQSLDAGTVKTKPSIAAGAGLGRLFSRSKHKC